jgi:hypothetical protein
MVVTRAAAVPMSQQGVRSPRGMSGPLPESLGSAERA